MLKTKQETGLFSNTNPSQENCISSYFGASVVSINCIAKYDSSRVEFYIEKPNKNENEMILIISIQKKKKLKEYMDKTITGIDEIILKEAMLK